ncbi:conjugal transfer protein TraH [Vreelandella lionensis]|uniref:conjugal transfer protein TraH n=1 Tax=Vreelandella lionensis TaxID=1144478 RepID=UPI0009F6B700
MRLTGYPVPEAASVAQTAQRRLRPGHGMDTRPGGLTRRFSQNRYSLVNMDPPRLDVGCNGIDAHFGGFSYIDSEQIQQMLEQIAQRGCSPLLPARAQTALPYLWGCA